MNKSFFIALLVFLLLAVGCASPPKYDYSAFIAKQPRSILVLPPINETTAVEGTYGYLTTVTRPLAEKGYYVFPVAVVDTLMKENGLPSPVEMQQAPVDKIREIIGADAILYITLKEYGTKYIVVGSLTTVSVDARLVDTATGEQIWEGSASVSHNPSSTGNVIADLVVAAVQQVVKTVTDFAHGVSALTNAQLVYAPGTGLLNGHYHPDYGTDLPE